MQTGIVSNKGDEDSARRASEKARVEEINQLKELLESTRTAKQDSDNMRETTKQETAIASQQIQDLKQVIETLEHEKAEASSFKSRLTCSLTI